MTIQTVDTMTKKKPAHNSTYKKLAVQWLNKHLCFASSSAVADSFVLRNRQLLVAANRMERPNKKDPDCKLLPRTNVEI